jgi:hypothetical protein
MNIRLPFTNKAEDYVVRKEGHYYILNDDIIVGNDFPKPRSHTVNNKDYKWPNAVIPVLIDKNSFGKYSGLLDMVYNALNEINSKLEICAVPYTNQKDHVLMTTSTLLYDNGISTVSSSIINGSGLSAVGKQGGTQMLYLNPYNASKRTVLHEMLHAAGVYHEQNRPDGDGINILINVDNIIDNKQIRKNFAKKPGNSLGPYDYSSIMHYSTMAFSRNGKNTIDCLNKGKVVACPLGMGTSDKYSAGDIRGIDQLYNEISQFPCNV